MSLFVSPPDAVMKKERFVVGTLNMCLNSVNGNGKVALFRYKEKYEEDLDLDTEGTNSVCVKRTNVTFNDNNDSESSGESGDNNSDNFSDSDNSDDESYDDYRNDYRNDYQNEGKVKLFVVFTNLDEPLEIHTENYYIGTRNMCLCNLRRLQKDFGFTRDLVAVYRLNINHLDQFDHDSTQDLSDKFFDILSWSKCMKCECHKSRNGKSYCDACLVKYTENSD